MHLYNFFTCLIKIKIRRHYCRYEGALDPWMSSLWNILYQNNPNLLPRGPNFMIENANLMDQPKFIVTYHTTDGLHAQLSTVSGKKLVQNLYQPARLLLICCNVFIFVYPHPLKCFLQCKAPAKEKTEHQYLLT